MSHEGGQIAPGRALGRGDEEDAAVEDRAPEVDGEAGLPEDGARPLRGGVVGAARLHRRERLGAVLAAPAPEVPRPPVQHGGRRDRALAAQSLRPALRNAAGGARRCALEGFAAAAGDLPPDAARLARRLHARRETVFDPETEKLLVQVPPLSEERLYPKEQALLDLVAAERLQGRRVLVYATHTGTRDITGRMEGVDVLVCHPRLVQTGLDLVEFPTICWYETEFRFSNPHEKLRYSWAVSLPAPSR